MTKSTGVGRGKGGGGRKPGAGRKPVGMAGISAKKAPIAASAPHSGVDRPNPEDVDALAMRTLRDVMEKSPSDAARVSAAKEWRVLREAQREAQGVNGKKAQAKAKAEAHVAGGGRFAPPSAPSSVVAFPGRSA